MGLLYRRILDVYTAAYGDIIFTPSAFLQKFLQKRVCPTVHDDLRHHKKSGAGGNRTPVHQPLSARDTTIPTSALRSTTGESATYAQSAEVAVCLSIRSSVFPNVNSLSCRHSPLLLPGCGELAPCDLAAHGCSLPPNYLGGESELLVGSYIFALFSESEQLGSHARTATLTSKPVSPVNLRNAFSIRRGCSIR